MRDEGYENVFIARKHLLSLNAEGAHGPHLILYTMMQRKARKSYMHIYLSAAWRLSKT
jgi:hypothetical protein